MNAAGWVQWGLSMVAGIAMAQGQLVIDSGTPPPYQSGTITTSGSVTLASGSCVAYTATQQISLEPGFHAAAGSTFDAKVGPLLTVATTALGSGAVGVPFSAVLTASGGTLTAGGTYTWSGGGGLPGGVFLYANGTIIGTPQNAVAGAQVTVTVRDSTCQQATAVLSMTTDQEYGTFTFTQKRKSVWFGGKLIAEGPVGYPTDPPNPVFQDRLGTNRAGGARYYPYGDEITSTANDRTKFATYSRDAFTGLDYADQRFYASTYGRFSTPDPGAVSSTSSNPGSLNQYWYVLDDPINLRDTTGLAPECVDGSQPGCETAYEAGGDGGFDPYNSFDSFESSWGLAGGVTSGNGFVPILAGVGVGGLGSVLIGGPVGACIASVICGVTVAVIGGTAIWILTHPGIIQDRMPPPVEIRRLVKVQADCSVHQVGTPNHASAGTISTTGSGVDFSSAKASAYSAAQAAVQASYGVGYHAQHCGYTELR